MQIIIGSDFHLKRELIEDFTQKIINNPECLAIYCGDLVNNPSTQLVQYNHITSIWKNIHPSIIIVPGNHDPVSNNHTGQLKLISRTINGEVKNILCIGGMPKDQNWWSYEFEEYWLFNELKKYLQVKIDFIISHSPPYQLVDYDVNNNWGSKALKAFIELHHTIKYVFCGHVHGDDSRFKLNKFEKINAQILNSAKGISEISYQ